MNNLPYPNSRSNLKLRAKQRQRKARRTAIGAGSGLVLTGISALANGNDGLTKFVFIITLILIVSTIWQGLRILGIRH